MLRYIETRASPGLTLFRHKAICKTEKDFLIKNRESFISSANTKQHKKFLVKD